ncbi:TIGR03016 family PEP-CTERM system-associated outer membrane protein [Ectothiorhodospira lacustris]|uniref:TIGR03016 family PEP-CTERM system-associated outer membrane protein n=1 Tax=Ectothiorhodospira lacustris TaxID=2899127 RepID=UPI001EE89540|nr:TIGR03016 family PEP-CTERM system-associated outer membrane protein [Ectothiorhodospira lacustris]MCG5510321.1 TIGR03016 family PEP-CTERM system-associated outer membrane protein [Ectothiorhodospira lacustris]MCG5522067.1 TIGR03016 family PEP-CTERM system-associated outer membrane protein [Ectothiorhodospira lacustris]
MKITPFGTLLGSLALVHAGAVQAGSWDFTPRVSVSQTYTDNVNLAARGEDKESDSVSQLNTGFSLQRAGGRTDLSLGYNLQSLAYWDDDSRNNVYHQLAGTSTSTLIRETLFLDASATYGQQLLDARDGFAGDNISTGARSDVARYSLSPYWRQGFGRFAAGELRYTWDQVDYQSGGITGNNSENQRIQASLNSGPQFTTVAWTLSYSWDESTYDDGTDVTLESLEALVRLNISPQFSVYAAGGEERNEYNRAAGTVDPDDNFWRAGFTWLPGPRTSLDAFYGERFFGDTYGLSFSHRFRHATWQVNYSESITSLSRIEFVPIGFIVVDDELLLIVDPQLVPDAYISKRLDVSVAGQRSKLSWGLAAALEERLYQTDRGDQEINSVSANLGWRVAPRTQATLSSQWQRSDYDLDSRKDDLWNVSLGVSRTLGPSTSATLQYRYQERDSNQEGFEYQENRITATLSRTF